MKKKNIAIERVKKALVEQKIKQMHIHLNSKYGQFIIQTNNVQSLLFLLILSRTVLLSKRLIKYLERLTLGNLINCFRINTKNPVELSLIDSLDIYNGARNALVHKMYTKQALTERDCELSIKLGEELLIELKALIRESMNKKIDPNKIPIDSKEWIEDVSDNFEDVITTWIKEYRDGILTKEDVLRITEKVAKFRNDNNLVNKIKQRMGLKNSEYTTIVHAKIKKNPINC